MTAPHAGAADRTSTFHGQRTAPDSAPVTVSIIVPVFNRLDYLRVAVQSVFAQTFQDWELVVADDGSDADMQAYLSALVSSSRVKVVRLPHTGNPAAVRNVALRVASGEYVAFLDSDDFWMPRKLATQLTALRSTPNCLWSYSALTRVDAQGTPLPSETDRQWTPYAGAVCEQLLRMDAIVATPTVMAARGLVEWVGGFDESLDLYEDYDLWLRLSLLSETRAVIESLACVRNHDRHYSSGGVRAALARDVLLAKMQTLVNEPRLLQVVFEERRKNSIKLARQYAAMGDVRAVAHAIWRSKGYSWRHGRWYWGMSKALLRLFVPATAAAAVRRLNVFVTRRFAS